MSAEVTAIRYGTLATTRGAAFAEHDHGRGPETPIRLDYFFWLVRSAGRVILVDTGFHPVVGARRGRDLVTEPLTALEGLGVATADVDTVVITHCHYDHIGNLAAFPDARVLVQDAELAFWASGGGADARDRELVEADELRHLTDRLADGTAVAVSGDHDIAPGVRSRLFGGHTPGQQIVTVDTPGGLVVLASDALHFYEEMERFRPYRIASDVNAMLAGYRELDRLRSTGAAIVAGHDPDVMSRFGGGETFARIAA